jgi:hypothetical protein
MPGRYGVPEIAEPAFQHRIEFGGDRADAHPPGRAR